MTIFKYVSSYIFDSTYGCNCFLEQLQVSNSHFPFFISILSSFGVAEAENAKSGSDTEEEDEGEGGLLANADELNREIAPPSRSRQMNAGNLDAKIVKALKKQEEKREKRVTRKKEVCQYVF